MQLDVLFMDNHLLVVSKPPGLLVQADRTGDPDLLSVARAFIREKCNKPGRGFMGLVHRLDRPVSGVMVLALSSKAASRLSEQFRRKVPEKRYLAIVEGVCRGEGNRVDYLVKENQKVRIVKPSHPKARHAELSWRAVAQRKDLSLLEIKLKTGRAHQVRVQLAHMGFPIIGDFRYGAKRELDGKNLALHCCYLALEHPVKREMMHWKAAPPASWCGFFDKEIVRILKAQPEGEGPGEHPPGQ
jgi:RluA family pseudouridine synthase